MLKIMQIHRYIAGLELGSESESSKSLSGGGCFVSSLVDDLMTQGSLNYPFGRNQTMQMYGHFEGFPLNSALFGLVI